MNKPSKKTQPQKREKQKFPIQRHPPKKNRPFSLSAKPQKLRRKLSQKSQIDSNGNVGIGTTTVTEKLEVSGTVKATNFAPGTQSVAMTGQSTIAANGARVILVTLTSGTNNVSTITGCNSGAYQVGEEVTLVIIAYAAGSFTYIDTAVGTATSDALTLSGAVDSSTLNAAAQRGSNFTFMCVDIGGTKKWVEIARTSNSN